MREATSWVVSVPWAAPQRADLTLRQLQVVLASEAGAGSGGVATPYAKVATVYAGVRAIAQTIAGMRVVLHRGRRNEPLERGPAFEFLRRPQPQMTGAMLLEQIAGHLVESGEAHLLRYRPAGAAEPQLLVVGRRQMQPEVRGGTLVHWWYLPHGGRRIAIAIEEDFCLKLFNPYGARGLSPLEAATANVRQSYAASVHAARTLDYGGTPGAMFRHPDLPGEESRRQVEDALNARFSRPENAGRPMVLWGGLDYVASAAASAADLELIAGAKFSREEILSALGVPPVLAGIYESAHYDVADQAIAIFLQHVIAPLRRSIEELFNLWLLPLIEPGVEVWLDDSQHPAYLALQTRRFESLRKAIGAGVPWNQAAPLVGLDVPPQAWGDESLLESGLSTAADVIAGVNEGLPAQEQDQPAGEQSSGQPPAISSSQDAHSESETARELAASQQREERRAIEAATPPMQRRWRALLLGWERRLLSNLRRELRGARSGPQAAAEGAAGEEDIVARVLLDRDAARQQVRALARETWTPALRRAIEQRLEELGVPRERIARIVESLQRGRYIRSVLRLKEARLVGVERVTRRRVQAALLEGLRKGETVTQLSERVQSTLGGFAARAARIARTEAGQAVSTGRFLAVSAAGVRRKGWLTGPNPRASHTTAGLRYPPRENAIAMDELFEVGGERLLHPRDPRGSAAEIINCNCVLAPTNRGTREDDE